ncbi:TetR/AcrR family transcriptional regulator [Roseobacteraceae bacterium NS-SX3]
MPKIVDHAAYREELARRAAALFSEHGYSGLGMRKIAAALGVSKSALYHYFPTKKDLFLACTAAVMAPPPGADEGAGADPVARLMQLASGMRAGFAGEMSLLFDYLRGMPPEEIARDPAMQVALEALSARIAAIAGEARAPGILAQIMGALMLDYFSGGTWPEDQLRQSLTDLTGR